MSNQPIPDSTNDNPQPSGSGSSRPPIHWPTREAIDIDNQKAAEYARAQVARSFDNELVIEHRSENQSEPQTENDQSVSDQQSQPTSEVAIQNNNLSTGQSYDWAKYHSAWQQYYHQYYNRYYTTWWQQNKPQLQQFVEYTKVTEKEAPKTDEQQSEHQKIASQLRNKIRNTAIKNAQKAKQSSHFKPALAAFSVAMIFLFINYNQVIVGAVKQYVTPGSVVTTPIIVEQSAEVKVGPQPLIIIPKIGVEANVVYDEPRVDEASYQKALDRGVVRLGNTPDPGTKGNTVIGGHSSNNIFNLGKYKFVFVNLKRLDVGDVIYLNFKSKRYTYKVTRKPFIVSPTQVDSVLAPTSTPTITLFTCDPPGANVNRLIIKAEQIDPDPSAASENTKQPTEVNRENPLPSVAPSIWDRIFGRS